MSKQTPLNIIYRKVTKPVLDFCFSFILIIILFPLLLVIYLLVLLKLGKPVIFKQQRPGYKEKIFTIYKFRTMTDKKDNEGNILPDKDRLTRFGKFLRSTSLDELPELFNILKGEMSFIGPRPLLVQYLPLYNKEQRKRHDVKPGLSGLAQTNGRNSIDWISKFKLDTKYTNDVSFILDIKILAKTMLKVLKREGVNSETSATMEYFRGN